MFLFFLTTFVCSHERASSDFVIGFYECGLQNADVLCCGSLGLQSSPMRMPAAQYLILRAIGAPAVVVALAVQGVFRGFKDTKTPLYATSKWSEVSFVCFETTKYNLRTFFFRLVFSVGDFVLTQGFYLLIAVGGNVVNIALDPILIFTLKLGVSGAAIATVISQ